MAERPRVTQEARSQTRQARPWLLKGLAAVGLASIFGSVSPVLPATAASTPAKHAAPAHKHKTPPPTPETPVQKATTSTIKNLASQIIVDFNQAKANPPYQGVVYVPEHAPPQPGQEDFQVEYPTGTDTIVDNGTTENIGTGGYRLYATISYPTSDKNPPAKINLNNVIDVGISETTSVPSPGPVGPGYSSTIPGPSYYFSVRGNDSSSTTNQWDLFQQIDSTAGEENWSYVTGAGSLNKGNTTTQYEPFTMQELQDEVTATQTFLNAARQYVVTLITPTLEATLPPPTQQLP